MAKTLTQRNILIAVASFILIWFVVVKQKVSENMEDVKPLTNEDKKNITDYILVSISNQSEADKIKLSAEAKKFLTFLDQNQLTSVNDKFIEKITEIVKRMSTNDVLMRKILENPDNIKKGVRKAGQIVISNVIWEYADTYEKIKQAPTPTEFKEQMTRLLLNNEKLKPLFDTLKKTAETDTSEGTKRIQDLQNELVNLENQLKTANASLRPQLERQVAQRRLQINQEMDSIKTGLDVLALQKSTLGPNTYPLSSSISPLVNQLFDIAFKYYFGEVYSGASIASGAWTAIIATVGSIGAIAIVAAIVYFVFLR